jgi:hypothetical protein
MRMPANTFTNEGHAATAAFLRVPKMRGCRRVSRLEI